MMPLSSTRLLVALAIGGTGLFSATQVSAEALSIAGTWRGESVCVTDTPACRTESVVYYIKDVPNRPDLVLVQADKVVEGKAITMGTGHWLFDRAHGTVEWRTPQRSWLLKVTGSRIEGTLTLADKTIFRKMTLEKQN